VSYVWLVLCLLQMGVIASWVLNVYLADSPAPHAAEHPNKPARPEQPAQGEQPLDPRRGEALLREGDYAGALACFPTSAGNAKVPLSAANQFHAGLCLEGLGRWNEALTAYRAASSQTRDSWLETAAQVAQARVWVRQNQTAEAKVLLYPLILRMGQQGRDEAALDAEALYLLGLALAREARTEPRRGEIDEQLVSPRQGTWPLAHVTAWVRPCTDFVGPPKPLPAVLEVSPPAGVSVEDLPVRGATDTVQVSAALESLAGQSGLHLEWAAQTRQRVEGRTVRLALDGMPLMDVVRALVEPHGLDAKIADGALKISAGAASVAERTAAARRALEAAVAAHPGHPLTPLAYLELANDAVRSDRLDTAAAWYERLLSEAGHSPYASLSLYNLGLVHKAREDFAAARKAFYRVVDRNPAHELVPGAFCQVGWTHLLEGQPAEALHPLRRAVACGPAHSEAVVTLAAAELLNGNPGEAHSVLEAARARVSQEPWRTTAALLDALARGAGKQSRQENTDLLAALLGLQKHNPLGVIGLLLAGRAYAELGLPAERAKVFEAALVKATGPWADEMRFGLAEHYCAFGKREAGRKLLEIQAAQQAGKWSRAARLLLASLALQDNQPQQCLTACAAMLGDPDLTDRKAVLQLMGGAYEQLGDYEKAARCFAGKLPE
jgi:tetratricopeptide (TPR) repeat protein